MDIELENLDISQIDGIGQAAMDCIDESTKGITSTVKMRSALNTAIALNVVCSFAQSDVLTYQIKDIDGVIDHLLVQFKEMLKSHLDILQPVRDNDKMH